MGCGVAFIWARAAGIPDPTTDPIVAATHLGVLATLSMGVLGAMHQFAPVITGRPLRSIRLARATFAAWLAASWLLPLGVATEQVGIVATSGVLAGAAIALLVVNFIPALSIRGKGSPVTGLRYAVVGAVVTACIGVAFVGDRRGEWFQLSGHLDLTMGVIGLFGWLGLTYVAVAEKLWPMFFLAHVPGRHRSGLVAVRLVPLGVALLSVGLAFELDDLSWGGAVILAVGLGAHLASLAAHVRHRRRKADLHLLFVLTSSLWLLAGAALALGGALVLSGDGVLGRGLVAAAVCAFGGWLLEALVGHAHKVVPFIVWSALRAHGLNQNPAGKPLMFGDLYGHRRAGFAYLTTTMGTAGLCAGFAGSLPWAIAAGGGLLAITGLVVATNLSITPIRMLSTAVPPPGPRATGTMTGEQPEGA